MTTAEVFRFDFEKELKESMASKCQYTNTPIAVVIAVTACQPRISNPLHFVLLFVSCEEERYSEEHELSRTTNPDQPFAVGFNILTSIPVDVPCSDFTTH